MHEPNETIKRVPRWCVFKHSACQAGIEDATMLEHSISSSSTDATIAHVPIANASNDSTCNVLSEAEIAGLDDLAYHFQTKSQKCRPSASQSVSKHYCKHRPNEAPDVPACYDHASHECVRVHAWIPHGVQRWKHLTEGVHDQQTSDVSLSVSERDEAETRSQTNGKSQARAREAHVVVVLASHCRGGVREKKGGNGDPRNKRLDRTETKGKTYRTAPPL